MQVCRNSIEYLIGLSQVRIAIRRKIRISIARKAAHAAVGPTLYTNVQPQIVIVHDRLQNPKCPRIRKSGLLEVTASGYILDLCRVLEALILLFTMHC